MSAEDTVDTIAGIIPVAIVAGVTMNVMDRMFNQSREYKQRVVQKPKHQKTAVPKMKLYSIGGNFSNVGF